MGVLTNGLYCFLIMNPSAWKPEETAIVIVHYFQDDVKSNEGTFTEDTALAMGFSGIDVHPIKVSGEG